jgi:hypothetical protein
MSFTKPKRRVPSRNRQISPSASSSGPSRSTSPPREPATYHHLVPPTRTHRSHAGRGPRHILSVPGQVYVQQASTSRGRHQLRRQYNQTSDNLDLDQPPDVIDDLNAPSSDFNFMTDVFVSDPPETAKMRQE